MQYSSNARRGAVFRNQIATLGRVAFVPNQGMLPLTSEQRMLGCKSDGDRVTELEMSPLKPEGGKVHWDRISACYSHTVEACSLVQYM